MDICVGYNGALSMESSNTQADRHRGKGVEAGVKE